MFVFSLYIYPFRFKYCNTLNKVLQHFPNFCQSMTLSILLFFEVVFLVTTFCQTLTFTTFILFEVLLKPPISFSSLKFVFSLFPHDNGPLTYHKLFIRRTLVKPIRRTLPQNKFLQGSRSGPMVILLKPVYDYHSYLDIHSFRELVGHFTSFSIYFICFYYASAPCKIISTFFIIFFISVCVIGVCIPKTHFLLWFWCNRWLN